MAKRAKKPDSRPATPVVNRFKLSLIRLLRSSTNLSLRDGPFPGITKVLLQFNIGANKERRTLLSDVECIVESFYQESDTTSAVHIDCTFQAVYNCKSKRFPSVKTLKVDEQNTIGAALFQTWSYIRHFVATASTQMGLPLLTLGMLTHDSTTGQVLLGDKSLSISKPLPKPPTEPP